MDVNTLSDSEKAALAKAQEAGVTITNKDGSQTVVSDLTKGTVPAQASGNVDPNSDAAKAAAAAAAAAAGKPQRPEHIPEKFWNADKGEVNVEAMAKSYAELERTRTTPPPAKAPDMGAGDPAKAAQEAATRDAQAKPAEQRTDAEKALVAQAEAAKAEADRAAAAKTEADAQAARNTATQAAQAEFAKDGKLSDATYQQLAKAGYDKATVDTYIAGQKAQAELILNSIYEQAGGKETFATKVAWGGSTYTQEEQNAFNAALRSGDAGQVKMAIQGLNARYAAEFGKGADTTVQTGSGTPRGNAFTSQNELKEAMASPKYAKDATYRAEVAERIAASQRQGIDIGIRVM